ncbi:MAG: hypothetical protein Q7J85_04340 [Bacillota bacterium]|nr:hypothetical protein [Bacillota bacterium]
MKNDFPGGTPLQVVAGPTDVLSAGSPPALRFAKSFFAGRNRVNSGNSIHHPLLLTLTLSSKLFNDGYG